MTTGSFEEHTAADVFRQLRAARATGRLRVTSPELRSVYFEQGRPVFAASSVITESLGETLLRAGKVKPDALREALTLTSSGRKLGAVLVELGTVNPTDLVHAIKEHVQEIIHAVIGLDSGTFRFEHQPLDDDGIVKLHLKTEALFREGVKRITNPRVLLRGLGAMDSLVEVRQPPQSGLNLPLGDAEKGLLESVNGSRLTLREICRRSSLPAMETCRFLFMLAAVGMATRILPD